jgi:hypothetical protein
VKLKPPFWVKPGADFRAVAVTFGQGPPGAKHANNNISKITNITKVKNMQLYQNSPNPFNPLTEIKYRINMPVIVTLSIYSIKGELLMNLINNKRQIAGVYSLSWESGKFGNIRTASGIYIYKLICSDVQSHAMIYSKSMKMVLIK